MNRLVIIGALAVAAIVTGCKSIEVDRRARQVAMDGNGQVIKDAAGNPIILDMGWEVDYFQHWNTQKFDQLHAKAGEAELEINGYEGGAAASNLTALVATSMDGVARITEKVVAACVSGGMSVAADSGSAAIVALANKFISQGGNETSAQVKVDPATGTATVTDGCVTCSEPGCAECQVNPASGNTGGEAAK